MNDPCRRFEELVVDDEPAARAHLEAHARDCSRCAAALARHDELAAAVAAWKAATPEPRAALGASILAALAAEARRGASTASRHAAADTRAPSAIDRWKLRRLLGVRWVPAAALAASLLLAALIGYRVATFAGAPSSADRLLVAETLEEVTAAERAHARAIARLERLATPILARATDPSTPARDAARLLAYGHRLAFLDETIAEIHDFLDGNPAHPGARTLLLAAYNEKAEILREVIAQQEESTS